MALLRKHPRQNKSRMHLWDELVALDQRVEAIVALDAATTASNSGASGLTTLSLPTAVVGMEYIIERVASFEYRVDPDGTEKFQGSADGAYKSLGSDGAYLNIKCLSTGIWHVMASSGTITDE